MKIIFESECPCILRGNGEYWGEISGRAGYVEWGGGKLILECAPLSPEYLPFCRKLDPGRLADDTCFRVVRWSEDCCTLLLRPERRQPRRPLAAKAQLEWGEELFTLCDDGSVYLLAESPDKTRVLPIDHDADSAELAAVEWRGERLLQLTARGSADCYFGLYRVALDCAPLFEGVGEAFVFDGQTLREEKLCADMAGCRVSAEWRIEEGGAVFAGQRTLSYRRGFHRNLARRLIPYAFLEGVREQTDTAELFLGEELLESFTPEAGRDFFGDFIDARPSPIFPRPYVVALVYEEQGALSVKHFEFTLEGRKIANIQEK